MFYRDFKHFLQFKHNIVLTFPSVDETRVILQCHDPNVVGADYINANYVKVFLKQRNKYTQEEALFFFFFTINAVDLHFFFLTCVE